MPLIDRFETDGDGLLGIWQITETDEFFLKKLHLFEEEQKELNALSTRKKTEWLASRYLLHELSGKLDRSPCLKDEHGKPYLENSEYHISMSHSHDRVAVMVSLNSCGIDIQKIVEKITRIAKKYCSPFELSYIEEQYTLEYLHYIWGAKECMYKSYGKRNIDLVKEMEVFPFEIKKEAIILTRGKLTKPEFIHNYDIHGKIKDEYVLVYALDNPDIDLLL